MGVGGLERFSSIDRIPGDCIFGTDSLFGIHGRYIANGISGLNGTYVMRPSHFEESAAQYNENAISGLHGC